MVIIDRAALDDLTERARASPRRRMHRNLHSGYDDPCQHLIIAIEPDSYVRPHRHLTDPKAEAFIALKGRLALFLFDDDGTIASITHMGLGEDVVAVDLPAGVWHAVVSLAPGSVFYEAKSGPFAPDQPKDPAPWAPAEDGDGAADYLAWLKAAAAL